MNDVDLKHEESRADLIWGPSGTGKTHQVFLSALQMYKRFGKKTRYFTADGGSLGPIAPLYNLGIVHVFSLGLVPRAKRLEAVDLIMRGWWPIYDKTDGLWKFNVPAAQPSAKAFDEFGQLANEGLTSIADMSLRDLVQRTDIKIPQTPDRNEFFVNSGDNKWTFRAPSHVGFIQERMEEFVSASSVLPYKRILWTARELRGENKKGDVILGPELPGTAATGKVPGWFGACLHIVAVPGEHFMDDRPDLSMVAKDKMTHMEHRIYLVPHPDSRTGIILDSKNRLPAEVQDRLAPKGYLRSEITFNKEKDRFGKESLILGADGEPVVKERTGLNTYYDLESALQEETTIKLAAELGIELPKKG